MKCFYIKLLEFKYSLTLLIFLFNKQKYNQRMQYILLYTFLAYLAINFEKFKKIKKIELFVFILLVLFVGLRWNTGEIMAIILNISMDWVVVQF